FRREYYVGESFDKTGLEVVALTTEGSYTTDDYTVKFDSPFAEKAGEQTVTVTAYGFSESFKVRILNNEKTPILNSIYATFPEGFDFTYKGEPDLSGMQVYAVYSDGKEQELSSGEYTVTINETGLLLRKSAQIKVEYEGCSCSFEMKGV
ncbi:MAG: bacterial Ig-like domain-containing protein, partial [Clostridia bacterium]|nr:bacterial Ig-like domain-containing protein [Clostridia bacterium]